MLSVKSSRRHGFTLVELLIVLGISGALIATAAFSYSRMQSERRIQEAAQTMRRALVEARAQAVTPNDNVFGLTKVVIRFYTDGSNKIQTVQLGSNTVEYKPQVVTIPKNLYFVKKGTVNPPSQNATMYYFSFEAAKVNDLGRIIDLPSGATYNPVICVSNSQTPETDPKAVEYCVTTNNISGEVNVNKEK